MFPRFVWDFLNPRRWFRARNTTIALPAPPLPPSPSILYHPRMEEQESPEPEQVAPSRGNSTASSYKSAKGEISPSQSETNTPRRSLDSDAEEMQNDEENELKLHELSDQDSSSDDEEMEVHANTQVTTPPNLHGPSNFRRTSLVMKKRKLTDTSDEESKSQKRIKKATKVRPSPSSESTTSNESVEIVDEVIREPTRKNRRMSILVREKVDNESETPISTRKRLSNKTERFDPSSPAEVTRAKSRKENDTPSTSKVSSGRKEKEKEIPSTSAAKTNVAILLKQKTFATPSSSKSVKKSRMERDDTLSSVSSMSRLNVRASTPMNSRPMRACRAMTVSPTRFLRDTGILFDHDTVGYGISTRVPFHQWNIAVTPSRSISKVNTEKRATIFLIELIMERLARIANSLVRKIFKKRRNHRLSIEGGQGGWEYPVQEKMEMEEDEEMSGVTPPLSPDHSRALEYLKASTPVRSNGILEHEGDVSNSVEEEDEVSQAEECYAWDESIHSVQVDSPEQFQIDGGDDSSSIVSEDGRIEEKKDRRGEDIAHHNEFILEDEYDEDGFDGIALLQSSFPIQLKNEEEYFYHPTVLKDDKEGYYMDEPLGYSNPSLAPSISAPLTCPNLCSYNEEDLGTLAQSIIEEDRKRLKNKKEKVKAANKMCVVYSSPSFHPSPRPDTPTPNEMISPTCRSISNESMVSASSGKTVTSLNPSTGEIVRPEYANDENNAFLRSIYEKAGLAHEIPDWMRVDPPSHKMYISEDSSLFDYSLDKSQEESKVVGKGSVINTSTPVVGAPCNIPFSSISTIGNLNDSNCFYSPSLDGSLIIRGERYAVDVSVRATVALARPFSDACLTVYDVDIDDDE
ncbi:hypothetical protein PRIPAC_75061 [Pristionchus pacificus]|uniref:Uncharacterized protein n=1 Tax=Pristionchus pacificus TaxID=54126 RepID=A0A2A6CZK6_PRIPA|nr:hypothetical protein PRIPAC_75061 [Pristionchus pacificus]|eukprot:PDM83595.1 hypothetical protein PRIPAC_30082 [Pristionchus pacificus]